MKSLLTLLLLLTIGFSLLGQDYFTPREIKMIEEINSLRSNPSAYIPKIENYIKMCDRKLKMMSNGSLITTANIKGQINAAKELIVVLRNTNPLNELIPNIEMYSVTKAHGQYLGLINGYSHRGPNDELAPQRMYNVNVKNVTENIVNDNGMISPTIILLLVDAGIESRGHRKNLLDPNAKFISVYTNGDTWVQNFAN